VSEPLTNESSFKILVYRTGSKKRAHFALFTIILLIIYWVRRTFKLKLSTFIRLRKPRFMKF